MTSITLLLTMLSYSLHPTTEEILQRFDTKAYTGKAYRNTTQSDKLVDPYNAIIQTLEAGCSNGMCPKPLMRTFYCQLDFWFKY